MGIRSTKRNPDSAEPARLQVLTPWITVTMPPKPRTNWALWGKMLGAGAMLHRRHSPRNLGVTHRRRALSKIQPGITETKSREPITETGGFRSFCHEVEGVLEE